MSQSEPLFKLHEDRDFQIRHFQELRIKTLKNALSKALIDNGKLRSQIQEMEDEPKEGLPKHIQALNKAIKRKNLKLAQKQETLDRLKLKLDSQRETIDKLNGLVETLLK